MSKGSKRRPGKPGAYEEGWERIFGAKRGKKPRILIADGEGTTWVVPNLKDILGPSHQP